MAEGRESGVEGVLTGSGRGQGEGGLVVQAQAESGRGGYEDAAGEEGGEMEAQAGTA